MKKIFFSIAIFFSLTSFSQDSTIITISPQARDVEYFSAFIYDSYNHQEIFDSAKVKFRVANPPTNNTAVSITGYTIDWIELYLRLSNDALAIKNGCKGRIETLLRNLNQSYLTGRLNSIDSEDIQITISRRIFGRHKLRRQ